MTTTPAGNPTTAPTPHSGMPAMGDPKYYNPTTGAYNWEAHVVELNYKMQQRGATEPPAAPPATTQPPAQQAPAALDVDAITAEVTSTGSLSDASKAALKAAGVPDAMVAKYVEMATATTAAATQAAYAFLGGDRGVAAGEAEWKTIQTWANTNLTEAERTQYSQLLNQAGWEAALSALRQRALGGPALVTGGVQGATPNVTPFLDANDQTRAINAPDPQNPKKRRYDTDPAYQKEVQARMLATARARRGAQ